jgi:serine/threonine protein kinase
MVTFCEATDAGIIVEFPKQIGRYSYIRTLACATTSVLVLVEDASHSQFAAKLVSRELLERQGQLKLFEREVRLHQFIRHPNIVRLYDIVYLPKNIVLVMEYCEGGDIFRLIWHSGALPLPSLRSFVFQVLKGLECLHEKGYAHRDLKPENLLLFGKSTVKICDLGLARAAGPDELMSTICGTVPYAAPEILASVVYDGARADVWSLGIVTFVMATGRLPWLADDQTGMIREIMTGYLDFPNDFPEQVLPFCRRCLRVDPRDRPTVTELLDLPWLKDELPAYITLVGRTAPVPTLPGLPIKANTNARTANDRDIQRHTGRRYGSLPRTIPVYNPPKLQPKMVLAIPVIKTTGPERDYFCGRFRRDGTDDAASPG